VLGSSHSGLVNGLIIALDSNIEDHNSTIVATDSKKSWEFGMEVQAHYTRLSCELVLWICGIFYGEAANETSILLQEIVRTIADSKKIAVSWVPADRCYVLFARSLS